MYFYPLCSSSFWKLRDSNILDIQNTVCTKLASAGLPKPVWASHGEREGVVHRVQDGPDDDVPEKRSGRQGLRLFLREPMTFL